MARYYDNLTEAAVKKKKKTDRLDCIGFSCLLIDFCFYFKRNINASGWDGMCRNLTRTLKEVLLVDKDSASYETGIISLGEMNYSPPHTHSQPPGCLFFSVEILYKYYQVEAGNCFIWKRIRLHLKRVVSPEWKANFSVYPRKHKESRISSWGLVFMTTRQTSQWEWMLQCEVFLMIDLTASVYYSLCHVGACI